MKNERALVISGGGVAGIPWATGVLTGLADAGVDVTDAVFLFGTSAGSVVAAQITSGVERPTLPETMEIAVDRCDGLLCPRVARRRIPLPFLHGRSVERMTRDSRTMSSCTPWPAISRP
jgi:predicted acylesterase/phospholipase RssA